MTVKPIGCRFDPHSRRWNIYLNLYFHFFALVSRQNAAFCSATQHPMPPESGRKWGTECLNTRFPLPAVCGIQRDLFICLFLYSIVYYKFWDRIKNTLAIHEFHGVKILCCHRIQTSFQKPNEKISQHSKARLS